MMLNDDNEAPSTNVFVQQAVFDILNVGYVKKEDLEARLVTVKHQLLRATYHYAGLPEDESPATLEPRVFIPRAFVGAAAQLAIHPYTRFRQDCTKGARLSFEFLFLAHQTARQLGHEYLETLVGNCFAKCLTDWCCCEMTLVSRSSPSNDILTSIFRPKLIQRMLERFLYFYIDIRGGGQMWRSKQHRRESYSSPKVSWNSHELLPILLQSPYLPRATGVKLLMTVQRYVTHQDIESPLLLDLLQMIQQGLSIPSIAEQVTELEMWLPLQDSCVAIRESFLGGLFQALVETSAQPPELQAQTQAIQHHLSQILKSCVQQQGRVQQATLTWLASASNFLSHQKHDEHALAFGLHLSSVCVLLSIDMIDYQEIDVRYQLDSSPGRMARQSLGSVMFPTEKTAFSETRLQPSVPLEDPVPSVYHPEWTNDNMSCQHCQETITGIRYSCMHCPVQYELCALCFRQDLARNGYEKIVHPLHHVFLRLSSPAPFPLDVEVPDLPAFARLPVNTNPRDIVHPETTCAECHVSPIRGSRFHCHTCAQRDVCETCLLTEERLARSTSACRQTLNPHNLHRPGHFYLEITRPLKIMPFGQTSASSATNNTYSKFKKTVFPSTLVPQVQYNLSTELFHLTLMLMHQGPMSKVVQSLSRPEILELLHPDSIENMATFYDLTLDWMLSDRVLGSKCRKHPISLGSPSSCASSSSEDISRRVPLTTLPEHLLKDMFVYGAHCMPQWLKSLKQHDPQHHLYHSPVNALLYERMLTLIGQLMKGMETTQGCRDEERDVVTLSMLVAPMLAWASREDGGISIQALVTSNRFLSQHLRSTLMRQFIHAPLPTVEHELIAEATFFQSKVELHLNLVSLIRALPTQDRHRHDASSEPQHSEAEPIREEGSWEPILQVIMDDARSMVKIVQHTLQRIKSTSLSQTDESSTTSCHLEAVRTWQALLEECLEIVAWFGLSTHNNHEASSDLLLSLAAFLCVTSTRLQEYRVKLQRLPNSEALLAQNQTLLCLGIMGLCQLAKVEGVTVDRPSSVEFVLNTRRNGSALFASDIGSTPSQRHCIYQLHRPQSTLTPGPLRRRATRRSPLVELNVGFVIHVARVGLLEPASELLSQVNFQPPYNAWSGDYRLFVALVRFLAHSRHQLEEGLGCPQEYQDPLLHAVMTDPVMLPSGQTCDRAVLSRMLSESPMNPFTREPLSLGDTRTCVTLRKNIQHWLTEKLDGCPDENENQEEERLEGVIPASILDLLPGEEDLTWMTDWRFLFGLTEKIHQPLSSSAKMTQGIDTRDFSSELFSTLLPRELTMNRVGEFNS